MLDPLDNVFHALASIVRREILDILCERQGSSVSEVCAHFDISRIAVMKHLAILEAASLVTSEKEGRVRKLFFNTVPIQMVYDRWADKYAKFWSSKLVDMKSKLESKAKVSR